MANAQDVIQVKGKLGILIPGLGQWQQHSLLYVVPSEKNWYCLSLKGKHIGVTTCSGSGAVHGFSSAGRNE